MNSSAEHEIINLSKQKWDWMSARDVAPLAALFNEAAKSRHWRRFRVAAEDLAGTRTPWLSASPTPARRPEFGPYLFSLCLSLMCFGGRRFTPV
jgi:hypothetical protein